MCKLIHLVVLSLAVFLIAPILSVNAQQYGKVDFRVGCDESVQDDFDRALAMLHNMMYVTAREGFSEITKADPNCAMAYWGVATTLFQPLWGTRPSDEDLRQGLHYIEKASGLVDSEREGYLIKSTSRFFHESETADFWTRIQRWAEALEEAYNAYPEDLDVAALYSLSRLAVAQISEERDPLHDEAEDILQGIYEQEPEHPGAIHYSIHATDVDGRAENALEMVEAYGKIAPEVPHALHMPTHIYVRLGNWTEVIGWNKASAEAALNHSVNGAISHHYVHAVDYLVYAYLQRGEDEKAETVMEEARTKELHQASTISSFHLAAIPARLAVERRNWEQATLLEPRTPEYLPWDEFPWAEGLVWYARGLGAVHTNDINTAREAERQLKRLRDGAKESGAGDMATYIEIDRQILSGWIAHAQGDEGKAEELIRSAAELEASSEKHPVTPGALLPPNEALGDLLLELNRPEEALEAYKASDNIWPERYNTLLGAARAAKAAEKEQEAQKYYQRLLANAENSDRTGVHEAEGYIAEQ